MKKCLFIVFVSFLIGTVSCSKDDSFSNVGLYSYFDETQKWGYIDKNGIVKIEPQWDYSYDFLMGRGLVYNGSKYGYIDENGLEVIPVRYDYLSNCTAQLTTSDNPTFLALAKLNGLYGYINSNGDEFIPLTYTWATTFSNDMAAVRISNKYGFINLNGELVVPAIYDGYGFFTQNLCWVGKKIDNIMKWGVIDKEGNEILPFTYEGPYNNTSTYNQYRFVNGISPLRTGTSYGFMNSNGSVVLEPQYQWTNNFNDGLACIVQNDLAGFVNADFEVIITPQFWSVSGFKMGLSSFKYSSEQNYGYVNMKGNVVIPTNYLKANLFNEDLAWVMFTDSTNGYLNQRGSTVWRSANVLSKSPKNLMNAKGFEPGME